MITEEYPLEHEYPPETDKENQSPKPKSEEEKELEKLAAEEEQLLKEAGEVVLDVELDGGRVHRSISGLINKINYNIKEGDKSDKYITLYLDEDFNSKTLNIGLNYICDNHIGIKNICFEFANNLVVGGILDNYGMENIKNILNIITDVHGQITTLKLPISLSFSTEKIYKILIERKLIEFTDLKCNHKESDYTQSNYDKSDDTMERINDLLNAIYKKEKDKPEDHKIKLEKAKKRLHNIKRELKIINDEISRKIKENENQKAQVMQKITTAQEEMGDVIVECTIPSTGCYDREIHNLYNKMNYEYYYDEKFKNKTINFTLNKDFIAKKLDINLECLTKYVSEPTINIEFNTEEILEYNKWSGIENIKNILSVIKKILEDTIRFNTQATQSKVTIKVDIHGIIEGMRYKTYHSMNLLDNEYLTMSNINKQKGYNMNDIIKLLDDLLRAIKRTEKDERNKTDIKTRLLISEMELKATQEQLDEIREKKHQEETYKKSKEEKEEEEEKLNQKISKEKEERLRQSMSEEMQKEYKRREEEEIRLKKTEELKEQKAKQEQLELEQEAEKLRHTREQKSKSNGQEFKSTKEEEEYKSPGEKGKSTKKIWGVLIVLVLCGIGAALFIKNKPNKNTTQVIN